MKIPEKIIYIGGNIEKKERLEKAFMQLEAKINEIIEYLKWFREHVVMTVTGLQVLKDTPTPVSEERCKDCNGIVGKQGDFNCSCPCHTPKQDDEWSELPRKLHEWYLEACKEIRPRNYNANAQKSYDELNEEQKLLDKYIADKISQHYISKKKVREVVEKMLGWGYVYNMPLEPVSLKEPKSETEAIFGNGYRKALGNLLKELGLD